MALILFCGQCTLPRHLQGLDRILSELDEEKHQAWDLWKKKNLGEVWKIFMPTVFCLL